MLAYAANRRPALRGPSPKTLTLVVIGHVIAVGLLLTTKMVLEDRAIVDPIDVIFVPTVKPPPDQPVEKSPTPASSTLDVVRPVIEPQLPSMGDAQLPVEDGVPLAGLDAGPGVVAIDPPKPVPVRVAARFNTPDRLLRPPYPLSKIRSEEEASLRLKLSIDAQGRVVAVEPVGPADADFLAAARRHLIKAWRYKPAMEDGVAVPSTTVITLSFRLDNG